MTSNRLTAWQGLWAILLGIALLPWPAIAAAGDAAPGPSPAVRRGERLAREQCSACHVVAEKQEYPPLLENPAPSFQSIANRPQTTEKSLGQFVTKTHWDLKTVPMTMPNPELTNADRLAVIRYILSLKGH